MREWNRRSHRRGEIREVGAHHPCGTSCTMSDTAVWLGGARHMRYARRRKGTGATNCNRKINGDARKFQSNASFLTDSGTVCASVWGSSRNFTVSTAWPGCGEGGPQLRRISSLAYSPARIVAEASR